MEQNTSNPTNLLRWLPLLILLSMLFVVVYFQLYSYLSFVNIKQHRSELLAWTTHNYTLTSLCFIAVYIFAVAISLPGASLLTMISGFLFGLVIGSLYAIISATIGAVIVFLAMKTSLRELLVRFASRYIKPMEQGFANNAFNYLLVIRLVPLFPFWVTNIIPALLNVPLRTFAMTTFLGIIPGSVIYVWLGTGLRKLFEQDKTPDLSIIFTPQIILPLLALSALALLPVLYKQLRHH